MKIKGQGERGEDSRQVRLETVTIKPHGDLNQNSPSSSVSSLHSQLRSIFSQLLNRETTLFLLLSRGVAGLVQFPLNLEFMRKCWVAVYKNVILVITGVTPPSSLSSVGLLGGGGGNGYLIGTNDELII